MHAKGLIRTAAILIAVACACLPVSQVSAHTTLSEAVFHENTIEIGPAYIDVSISLTHMGHLAEDAIRAVDADADGLLAADELKQREQWLLRQAAKKVRLYWGDRELELVPLYDPEVKAAAPRDGKPSSVTSRLWFFARTPSGLKPTDTIRLDEAFFADAPGRYKQSAKGRDRFRVRLVSESLRTRSPNGDSAIPSLIARVDFSDTNIETRTIGERDHE